MVGYPGLEMQEILGHRPLLALKLGYLLLIPPELCATHGEL